MPTRTALITAVLALSSTAAVADPLPPAPAPRKPEVAFGLSLGVTLASGIAIAASAATNNASLASIGGIGVMFGPSAGEWYSGQVLTTGLGMRAGGSLLLLAGVATVFASHPICFDFSDDNGAGCPTPSSGGEQAGDALMVAGGLLFLGGVVYDIVDAPRAAGRFNAAHALQLAPSVAPTPSGMVPTVALSGRF